MHKHYTTHPADGETKRVIPASRPHNVPETPRQRMQRLMDQAAVNRIRVKTLGEGCYSVPSQRKGPDGAPKERYTVCAYPDLGGCYSCNCVWGAGNEFTAGHGSYCAENEIALCSHIAQVIKHDARAAREAAHAAQIAA